MPRRAAVDLKRLYGQPPPLLTVYDGVLQHEPDLEERMVRERALGLQFLDEPFKRDVLIGKRAERGFPGAPESFPERRIVGKLCPQDERIDEITNQRFGLRTVAAGDRRPDDNVVLTGEAREQ